MNKITKAVSALVLSALFTSALNAFNIGYLPSDYGFPARVDRFQWQELEETGRTILSYHSQGPIAMGDWIGVSLIAIEREHLPKSCLERMRYEFGLGVEDLDLFVMKKDRQRKLLRISTTNLPAFSISNSIFVLEFNGLYRTYSDEQERPTERPILRSGKSQSRIDLLNMNLDPAKPLTRHRIEKLLQVDSDFIMRPLGWDKINTPKKPPQK